jgi:hypothetical protein
MTITSPAHHVVQVGVLLKLQVVLPNQLRLLQANNKVGFRQIEEKTKQQGLGCKSTPDTQGEGLQHLQKVAVPACTFHVGPLLTTAQYSNNVQLDQAACKDPPC